jgi:hypothetical protein
MYCLKGGKDNAKKNSKSYPSDVYFCLNGLR